MKRSILVIAMIACAAFVVHAQRPAVRVPEHAAQAKFVIPVNRTTGQSFGKDVSIKTWMADVPGKGPAFHFEASKAIVKVEVVFVEPKQQSQMTTYNANTTTGSFFLNSPAYGNTKEYMFRFFIAGHDDKYVWVSYVQREAVRIPGKK